MGKSRSAFLSLSHEEDESTYPAGRGPQTSVRRMGGIACSCLPPASYLFSVVPGCCMLLGPEGAQSIWPGATAPGTGAFSGAEPQRGDRGEATTAPPFHRPFGAPTSKKGPVPGADAPGQMLPAPPERDNARQTGTPASAGGRGFLRGSMSPLQRGFSSRGFSRVPRAACSPCGDGTNARRAPRPIPHRLQVPMYRDGTQVLPGGYPCPTRLKALIEKPG